MMPSVGAVDPDGRPVGPGLLYGDRRGRAPALSASASPSGARVGSDPTTSDEMARLAGWAAAQAPGAAGYWPAQAVANASLGGEGVIDLASAFAAGPLFRGPGWDEDVCARSGLRPGQLPRVAMFGEPIGHLRPGAVGGYTGTLSGEEFGEVVLGAGSVDGLCEQLVAGAIEDGDVLIALGSTLVVWLCVPGWPDEVPGLWRVPHIAAGKAMVGGASNAGGLWADWADRVLRPGPGGGAPSSEVLRPADVPLWWPWAHGERVPWHDPDLRISLSGADLSHGPLALRRAALEATGFVTRYIVERASGTGTQPRRYIVSGGGTSNPAWVQALADVLGQPVLPMATPAGAGLGAAFLARVAAGLENSIDGSNRWARWSPPVEPRPDWSEAASERYRGWAESLPVRLPRQ
jgi:xylulokinase